MLFHRAFALVRPCRVVACTLRTRAQRHERLRPDDDALAYHTGLDRKRSRSSRATRAYRKRMTRVHYCCRNGGLAAALPNAAASEWCTWKSYPEHVSCTAPALCNQTCDDQAAPTGDTNVRAYIPRATYVRMSYVPHRWCPCHLFLCLKYGDSLPNHRQ